jgi:ABC-2 type transport system ATP-binding protein
VSALTPAIELDGVAKRYWRLKERSILRSMVPFGGPNRSELWALRDVDLRIAPGETVGMIGRNGAGKSTLLRLLAGVSQPTEGQLTIRGRIAPLLSVGVGFHQEMTGRENVHVNGMLLGLSKREIADRFDAIVEFAELADFIDTPVKFYSSGMFMRLGFAVAIHVDPEVLLVDEVLAVGDVGFQLRCFDRMRALQRSGTTILFVSHSMHAIQLLCPRTVLMHRGRIEADGPTEGVIARYHELLSREGEGNDGDAAIQVVHRDLELAGGGRVEVVEQDQPLTYRTRLRFARPVDAPQIFFRVLAEDGTIAYGRKTTLGDGWRSFAAGEEATVAIDFRPAFGGGGTFRVGIVVTDDDGRDVLMHDQNGPSFYVPPRLGVEGVADLGATIAVDGEARTNHRSLRLDGRPHAQEVAS